MFTSNKFLYSPDGASGGTSSTEPTLEQLQQQLSDTQKRFTELQEQINQGVYVKPEVAIKTKVEAGELFPKERYTGLQQTLQTEQEAHKKTKEELKQIQANLGETTSKVSTFEKQLEELTSSLEAKEVELESLTRAKKRATLIFDKFPTLATFESQGLLPEVEEEKMEEVFAKFNEKVTQIATNGATAFASGGTPNSPSSKDSQKPTNTVAASAEAHRKMALEAFGKGDMAGYNKSYDAYLAELSKETLSPPKK